MAPSWLQTRVFVGPCPGLAPNLFLCSDRGGFALRPRFSTYTWEIQSFLIFWAKLMTQTHAWSLGPFREGDLVIGLPEVQQCSCSPAWLVLWPFCLDLIMWPFPPYSTCLSGCFCEFVLCSGSQQLPAPLPKPVALNLLGTIFCFTGWTCPWDLALSIGWVSFLSEAASSCWGMRAHMWPSSEK